MNDTKGWERRETTYGSYVVGDPLCNNTSYFPLLFQDFIFRGSSLSLSRTFFYVLDTLESNGWLISIPRREKRMKATVWMLPRRTLESNHSEEPTRMEDLMMYCSYIIYQDKKKEKKRKKKNQTNRRGNFLNYRLDSVSLPHSFRRVFFPASTRAAFAPFPRPWGRFWKV